MTQDITAGITIPARYALNTALREMGAIWDEKRPDYWTQGISDMVKAGRVTANGLKDAIARIDPAIILSMARSDMKRLGKTVPVFDIIRMQPLRIHPRHGPDQENPREIIMLRRDVVTQRDREVDIRSGNMGIALDRHAAERLYERERCTPDEIVGRLRGDMAHLVRTVAFARASGIIKRARGTDAGETGISPGEATFVPMGKGALVVEALQLDVNGITARRTLVRRTGTVITVAGHDPQMTRETEPLDGHPAVGLIEMTGITYLSEDMLRPDQRDYLALFEDAMEAVDIEALTDTVGAVAMPHERHRGFPAVPAPAPRLMTLLRENVRRNKQPTTWRGHPHRRDSRR